MGHNIDRRITNMNIHVVGVHSMNFVAILWARFVTVSVKFLFVGYRS